MLHRIPVHPTAHRRADVIGGEHEGLQGVLVAVCYDDATKENSYEVLLDNGQVERINLAYLFSLDRTCTRRGNER